MKKVLITLLVLILACSLFAADFKVDAANHADVYAKIGNTMYQPKNVRLLGMGGAGIALPEAHAALFENPANLGAGKFQISLPSVGLTVNHVYDVFKGGEESAFVVIKNEFKDGNDVNFGKVADKVLSVIGNEYTSLATVDAAVSTVMPFGFGLGVSATDTLHTYKGSVIDEASASVAAGFGHGFDLGFATLNVGAAVKFNVIGFNEKLSTADAIAFAEGDKKLNETQLAIGYAIPVDAGAQLVLDNGLSVGAIASNFNGNYKMAFSTFDEITGVQLDDCNAFELETNPLISAGVAYTNKGFLNTKLAADIVDVVTFVDEVKTEDTMRVILKHMNAGMEINLLNTIAARAGISQGYYSVGASFNLMLLRVDAAYYWSEMGSAAGQRGLDSFSIRFNLGFEK